MKKITYEELLAKVCEQINDLDRSLVLYVPQSLMKRLYLDLKRPTTEVVTDFESFREAVNNFNKGQSNLIILPFNSSYCAGFSLVTQHTEKDRAMIIVDDSESIQRKEVLLQAKGRVKRVFNSTKPVDIFHYCI